MAKFQINGKHYEYPIYEADIEEECLLGLNFMKDFGCLINPNKLKMTVTLPYNDEVELQETRQEPTVRFITGSPYYTVRCSRSIDLGVNQSEKVELTLNADCNVVVHTKIQEGSFPRAASADVQDNKFFKELPFSGESRTAPACVRRIRVELPDGTTNEFPEMVPTELRKERKELRKEIQRTEKARRFIEESKNENELGNNVEMVETGEVLTSTTRPHTERRERKRKQEIELKEEFTAKVNKNQVENGPDTTSSGKDESQTNFDRCKYGSSCCVMSKETQIKTVLLGYLTSPSTFNYRQGASLQVTAGVVPCITAPVEITVTNQGRK